ncbi:MAG: methionyl-tRNA formyltransferase [Dehalococcoidales bacterium]|nr:methionyl-tRNA formyltransferase [Dehalococcoidales bacterium]MDP6576978.1 methionyl-tRNA formyltransferase [Dehalococcoidales bacterium]
MRVLFMGTPEFAVPPLEYLCLNHYQVIAVYTQPDRPAGRGRSLSPSPVKKAALARGLTVVQPANLKEAAAVAQLAGFRPDIIVVAAFGQILPPSVLEIPRHGCLNLHPSLLPRFRGAAPVAAAILAGDESTGVSIMLMDSGLDTGPVLARKTVTIAPQDTTGSLTDKLLQVAARLLPEVVIGWTRGEIKPQPQNEAGVTYCQVLTKKDGEIYWRRPAMAIGRQVRAYQPWPGSYTRWQGRRLEIREAVPLLGGKPLEAGRVVALKKEGAAFGVNTGDGILGVLRVQLEGKRAMSATEFVRGQQPFIGAVLPD